MKVTCLLFLVLTVSCASLMQGTSYAASPQRSSDKIHPRGRVGLTAANRPKQPSTGQKRPLARNAASLRQPAFARSGGAAKGGLVQSKAVNAAQHVRSTSALRPAAASLNPSLNNVRHRGPNPAVVGGSANFNSSNTGAINGTGMHHRP
ncbi:MAG: hypothetical protein ABR880_03800 [Candidatus Sulfotelmatobacter sp.]|jgi:hypothetical protein